MENEFEIESDDGMGVPMVTSENEPDLGAPAAPAGGKPRQQDARFDPAILFAEIKSVDWRLDATKADGTAQNAEGLNHPAVIEGGVIRFFEPVPSGKHSNWAGDQGGARSPWPFTAVKLSIEFLVPPTPDEYWIETDNEGGITGHNERVIPHSVMLAAILSRGVLSMEMGDVPWVRRIPVAAIGGGGGLHTEGTGFGSASNMMQAWTNAYKLPDAMTFTPTGGAALKAWIELNPADLAMLGHGNGGTPGETKGDPTGTAGWGQPFAPGRKLEYVAPSDGGGTLKLVGPTPAGGFTSELVQLPYFGIRLNLWGQRGINIRAGKASISQATAAQR